MDKHWIWSLGFLLVGEGVAHQTDGDKALQMCFVAAEEVFAHFLQALTASRAFRCLQVTWRPQADPDSQGLGGGCRGGCIPNKRPGDVPAARQGSARCSCAEPDVFQAFRPDGACGHPATLPLRCEGSAPGNTAGFQSSCIYEHQDLSFVSFPTCRRISLL